MKIPFADNLLFYYVRRLHQKGQQVAPIDSLQIKSVKRILLMLTTGMGDAVLSSAVFPNLRRALPDADIRLLGHKNWLELFRIDPNLNGLIPYQGQYRHFFPTIKKLRAFSPELTLILHGNDPDILPLAYLAGSRYIVRIPWKGTRFGFLLSNYGRRRDEVPLPDWHYIENRLRILETIGIDPKICIPKIHLAPTLIDRAKDQLQSSLGKDFRYWIFHTFAADLYKVWPLNKARALLEASLRSFPDWTIVLTGSSHDRATIARLIAGMPANRAANMAGQLTLGETAAWIAQASFLVGPDTGILHLAAALEIPTVALYAPTSASLVGPRSFTARHHILQKMPTCDPCLAKRCPYKPPTCMDQIPVERVLQSMRDLIQEAKE
jgi:ADP-heptose:LPS heptosyltransferase